MSAPPSARAPRLAGARLLVQGGRALADFVPAGGFIGRSAYASLRISDPRVSEAHALVSVRDGALRLLALRRRFSVGGEVLRDCALTEGQVIALAPGLHLEVLEVQIPERVLCYCPEGAAPVPLPDPAAFVDSPPRLLARWDPAARLLLWQDADALLASQPGQEAARFPIGSGLDHTFEVGGHPVRVASLKTEAAGSGLTEGVRARLVQKGDGSWRVHLGEQAAAFSGVAARLLEALAAAPEALDWASLAQAVWPDSDDWDALRGRLDVTLSRLRARLREHQLPADLIATRGDGCFVLRAAVDTSWQAPP